jgi:hypothetical protein
MSIAHGFDIPAVRSSSTMYAEEIVGEFGGEEGMVSVESAFDIFK